MRFFPNTRRERIHKFSCEPVAAEIISFGGLAELNAYRRKLLDLRLIGVEPHGIGFGNLSIRDGATDNFYITGSATGGIHELPRQTAQEWACDFNRNWVQYEVSDSIIGIVDSCCRLRIGCNGSSDHSLPRLKTVGRTSKSCSYQLEGRRVWNAGTGI